MKVETYYQNLSNIPVEQSGSFALINLQESHGFDKTLVNQGKGYNCGVDFTIERFLKKGLYYMLTASVYESKYKASDNVWRNTLYNGNYVVNVLGGKEWKMGKNDLFGFNSRLYFRGGNRSTPVDLDKSLQKQTICYDENQAFETQDPALFRCDFTITYRRNKVKYASEWAFQINNAFASPTYYDQVFDYTTNNVKELAEGSPFPNFSYKILF
jgi:hypothetical protein